MTSWQLQKGRKKSSAPDVVRLCWGEANSRQKATVVGRLCNTLMRTGKPGTTTLDILLILIALRVKVRTKTGTMKTAFSIPLFNVDENTNIHKMDSSFRFCYIERLIAISEQRHGRGRVKLDVKCPKAKIVVEPGTFRLIEEYLLHCIAMLCPSIAIQLRGCQIT